MRALYPTYITIIYIILHYFHDIIFLHLFTRMILGEEYRSLRSSLCSFLHSLLPHPSYAQIFSSALHSQTPKAYVPPSMWATKFHTLVLYYVRGDAKIYHEDYYYYYLTPRF